MLPQIYGNFHFYNHLTESSSDLFIFSVAKRFCNIQHIMQLFMSGIKKEILDSIHAFRNGSFVQITVVQKTDNLVIYIVKALTIHKINI